MKILHPMVIFMLKLSYVCTTQIEDTAIIHSEGGLFSSNESDNVLNYSGTARYEMCGLHEFVLAIVAYLLVASAPFIITSGIVIALIAFVVSSVDNESSFERSFEGSFKRNLFELGEKFIYSFTNQEKLDALSGAVGEAIEKATTQIEDTTIIHSEGGVFSSNESDHVLNYSDTSGVGNAFVLLELLLDFILLTLAPFIIKTGIVIALIAFVVSSVNNESSSPRSFEGSFKRNLFEIGEKFSFSSTNQENLDFLTGAVGKALEKATNRC